MQNGVCPKCHSSEVYSAYSRNYIEAGLQTDNSQPQFIINKNKGGPTVLYLRCFVCRNCGYVEQYVENVADLTQLADSKNWKKAERPG